MIIQPQQPPKNLNVEKNSALDVEIILQANEKLTHENSELKKQVEWFKQQFKLANQRHFGKSTETTSGLSLTLFDEVESLEPTEDVTANETITYSRKKKSVGRHFDISKFPREQLIHDLSDEEKICACGAELEKVGQDESTQIDHIPETFKVIEHVCLKYSCRCCKTIKSAKKPESPLPKCMATSGLIAEVIIKKYEQHLPLYRQSKIFERHGAVIPDNTLGNWVMGAAEVLAPLGEAVREQLPKVHVLQADETKVQLLKPDKSGYMWGYHSCDPGNRFILFEFNLSRSAEVVNTRLEEFTGILQTDGYSGYSALRKKSEIISLGCWDHARRKFTDVIKVTGNKKEGKALGIISLINQLYKVEQETKEMKFVERGAYRQEKAKPVLDKIEQRLKEINAPPKSLLGEAVTYALNQWSYLIEYVNHGEAEISNCWIENQIRPFALGRRNWLFAGNPESANKAALLYSLIQSCKLNDINARVYLEYVLNQVHRMRRGEVEPEKLLPQFIDKNLL